MSERHVGPRVEVDAVAVTVDGRPLVARVSATVEPGTCLVVRGDNGSGKTTLLRVVAGMLAASGGQVRVDGTVMDERVAGVRRRVAALLGPSATYRELTVHEHLLLVDASWGGDAQTVEARAAKVLDLLRIDHLADRFPHELSSGQRQLVDLALVLFRPADLLVLDEPEQRLDEERREIVTDVLRDRVEQGATAVVATHDETLAAGIADDELWLHGADLPEA